MHTSMRNGELPMEPELDIGHDTGRTNEMGRGSNNRTMKAETEDEDEDEDEDRGSDSE